MSGKQHECDAHPTRDGALGPGQYFGAITHERRFESFNLSTVVHRIGRSLPSHAHEMAFVSLLVEGSYVSHTRKTTFEFSPRQAVFHPEFFEHQDQIGPMGGVFFCAQIDLDAVLDTGERKCADARDIVPLTNRLTYSCLTRVLAALITGEDELYCESLIHEFAANLFFCPPRRGRGKPAWIKRVLAQLEDENSRPLQLADLAIDAQVHPMTLARLFRVHMGCSIGQYRQHVRATRAFYSVVRTAEPLRQVSQACGYADQSHMTRDFKKVFGVPPARLRRDAEAN